MNHVNPNRTADPEALVQCPYDKTHMIRVLRWPRHIIKCRKNHPTKDLRTCPFNARHEVPAVELRHHILSCPDQVIIHQEILHERKRGDEVKGNTDVPPYSTERAYIDTSEDWDEACRRNPIRVDPTLQNPNVAAYSRAGLTPAQRKEHRRLLKQLYEKKSAGLPVDDVMAAIRALTQNANPISSDPPLAASRGDELPAPPAVMRVPHGPSEAETQHDMRGVRRDNPLIRPNGTVNGLGAVPHMPGLGRGAARLTLKSETDKRYEILARLAAGRGGPRMSHK